MKTGTVTTKKARIIDIQLWGQWAQYDRVYFAWECKLIADPGKRKYKDLPNEYIKEGIFRFVDGNYSKGLPDAGMLGYVLDGRVSDITASINSSMVSARRGRALKKSDNLAKAASVDSFEDIYTSSHTRGDSTEIQLYHLFLEFDY